jgi:hypothetical protein
MPSAHLKEIFGTLRFRLTLWNTAILFVFVLVTLWGVREGFRLVLWNEADDELVDDAGEIKATIEQHYPDLEKIQEELERKSATHIHRGLHMRIFGADNSLLWSTAACDSYFLLQFGSRKLHYAVAVSARDLRQEILVAILVEHQLCSAVTLASILPTENACYTLGCLTIPNHHGTVGKRIDVVSPSGHLCLSDREVERNGGGCYSLCRERNADQQSQCQCGQNSEKVALHLFPP